MSSIKCGGFCCENFCTAYSPGEWERFAEAAKNKTVWIDGDGKEWSVDDSVREDVQQIAEMLILNSIDEDFVQDEGARLNGKYHYTCKNFNKETRLCMNYDNRPEMCRNYPENTKKECSYEQCGLKCKP